MFISYRSDDPRLVIPQVILIQLALYRDGRLEADPGLAGGNHPRTGASVAVSAPKTSRGETNSQDASQSH